MFMIKYSYSRNVNNHLTYSGMEFLRSWATFLREGTQVTFSKAVLLMDASHQIPCPLGLTLSLNLTSALVANVKGSVQVQMTPSPFRGQAPRLPQQLRIVPALQPRYVSKM